MTDGAIDCSVLPPKLSLWISVWNASRICPAVPEKLIVIHRTNAPVEYLYARAPEPSAPLPKPAPISPATRLDSEIRDRSP